MPSTKSDYDIRRWYVLLDSDPHHVKVITGYNPVSGQLSIKGESMNPFKKIDFEYAVAKFVRDFVMVFAASSVWAVGNPGFEGIGQAALAAAGVAVYRVVRDLLPEKS